MIQIGEERIIIRNAEKYDRPFIASTWIESEKRMLKRGALKEGAHSLERVCVINDHLDKYRFVVACSEDYPRTIVSWICYLVDSSDIRRRVYSYTVYQLRGNGLSRALMEIVGVQA